MVIEKQAMLLFVISVVFDDDHVFRVNTINSVLVFSLNERGS